MEIQNIHILSQKGFDYTYTYTSQAFNIFDG